MAVKRARDADLAKHKKQLRARFKKLVREVIMNQTWLSDAEEQGISMNVKKNVALVRQKRKPGMLTMAEKALMRSNPRSRTIEERKKLVLLMAGLECLSRIPPKIRARMVPVLHFMSINESRVIIRDGDLPICVYFILNGEVEMLKNVYNKNTKQTTEVPEAIFGPGDCFGDVEMVEDCPRMNTYVAMSGCEFLSIYDLDYDRILKPFMLKQWNEKKLALKAFDYFDFLTPEQIILACKYGNLAQYEPLDTIYLGETGSLCYVRFVLSGECVILQCLNMAVTNKDGEASFELTAIEKDKEGLDMFRSMKGLHSQSGLIDTAQLLATSSSDDDQKSGAPKKKQTMRNMNLEDIEKFCGISQLIPKRKKEKLGAAAQSRKTLRMQSLRRGTPWIPVIQDTDSCVSGEQGLDSDFDEDFDDMDSSGSSYYLTPERASVQFPRPDGSEVTAKTKSSASFEIFSASSLVNEDNKSEVSLPISTFKDPIETHFIDVGSLTYGSIFGLGEKMEHRVIMARTVVQCLLLPRYWLLEEEQNPGNIWNRRRFYFERNVPSRQDLFTNYLKTRQWNKFRHDYIQSLLDDKTRANTSKEEDIPIMCRIVETSDDAR